MPTVLVVDDDAAIREMVALSLEKSGYAVVRAASAAEARRALSARTPDLVVCDIYMPGGDGLSVLSRVRELPDPPPVILMTARGSLETAAEAERAGAFDYLAKPFDVSTLLDRARAALAARTRPGAEEDAGPAGMIVGSHPAIVEVYKAVARVAPLGVPVLVLGETGTGKELVARALHRFGARPNGPFVPVHCGAIPDTLLESELFGHRRGAFTDASRDRKGALSLADGGTMFLDEVGEVSTAFQVKLLRFLEDGIVTPLGAEKGEPVSVRVVAATHRDLGEMVRQGRFRQDLYYRLAGYEVRIPPLRDRLADLPALVAHLKRKAEAELGLPPAPGPTEEVLSRLRAHAWPGNVRELAHVLRRVLIDAGGLDDAAALDRALGTREAPAPAPELPAGLVPLQSPPLTLEEAERVYVQAVLESVGGNKSEAARLLGIERKTLARKLKREGVPVADDGEGDEP
ncbi:MAG: sigma-54-dependent Fis family transcriptional regulator [Acidobacteria bacterium]|nr:MAG: sigma-54-dependent Fis family transcriptional regulator [Acidobacteriota bacterium]